MPLEEGENKDYLNSNAATELLRHIEQFRREDEDNIVINNTQKIIRDNAIDQAGRNFSVDMLLFKNNLSTV